MRFAPSRKKATEKRRASSRPHRFARTLLVLIAAICSPPQSDRAAAADPLGTVRAFCEMDGRGIRLGNGRWEQVAPLVAWPLEPAWDRVRLIAGYEIAAPRIVDNHVEVSVTYSVVHDVRAGKNTGRARLETRVYRLETEEATAVWRLQGPPPPPYVFDSLFDAAEIQRSLEPGSQLYQSASVLVWMLMRAAGLDFPYLDTEELASRPEMETVEIGAPGDLVVYSDGAEAYHVGLLEAEDSVVSATLNAGVRRAPVAAFAGEVRFRRLAGALRHSPEKREREEDPGSTGATPSRTGADAQPPPNS